MQHVSPWLDLLTECILTIAEPAPQDHTVHDWLNQTARTLAKQIGPEYGVALIRVAPGPPQSPWANSPHAISCGVPKHCKKWRSRYTAAIVASGLTPGDFLNNLSNNSPTSWRLGETTNQPKLRNLGNLLAKQHNVASFVHCAQTIEAENAIPRGALILDAWVWDHQAKIKLPPKRLLLNIAKAVTANLIRLERQNAQAEDSLMGRLTPAQRKVADLLVRGLTEQEAATELDRSRHTVHQHVKAIYTTLSVRSRAEFMARCLPTYKSETNNQFTHDN